MLTHKGTQIIETSGLILRRATREDAEPMFRNWASDPEVTRFLTWPAHSTIAVSETVIGSWIQEYEKDSYYQWMIVLKELGQPIGSISVVRQNDRVEEAEIGYCIGSRWWHRGIMTEALTAVIEYLFAEVGMNRVAARHDPNNPHSGGVMRKCGMKYEGTNRACDRNNQGICDAAQYSILRSEWQSRTVPASSTDPVRRKRIQKAEAKDAPAIAELACRLWPDNTVEEMRSEMGAILTKPDAAFFIAFEADVPVGFAQCQLRYDYVEGTDSSPVGYLEGIYVVEGSRRHGIAGELLCACENWAKGKGCTEFASDCELSNVQSLQFHLNVGFEEVNRIICFAKKI